MAKDNITYPVGLEKLWEHFDGTLTLDGKLYAVILADTYDPETDQDADDVDGGATTANGFTSNLWDGTHSDGTANDTDNAIEVTGFTLTRTTTQLALKFDSDISFGIVTGGNLTPKYVGIFVAENATSADAARWPLVCLHAPFTYADGSTYSYLVDATGVVLWRC